jgi:transcriptional regulator with XRE-family HTH domain
MNAATKEVVVLDEHRAAAEVTKLKQDVGNRIRDIRSDKDMTQGDLAKLLGKSRSAIAQWETGNALPQLEDFHKMGVVFGVSPAFLAFAVNGNREINVPVMSYHNPTGSVVGAMSLDSEFFNDIQLTEKSRLRAVHLPNNDMVAGLAKGDVVIVNELDRNVSVGASTGTFLIFHDRIALAVCGGIPGRKDVISVRIGKREFEMKATDLPVIGRVVATLKHED